MTIELDPHMPGAGPDTTPTALAEVVCSDCGPEIRQWPCCEAQWMQSCTEMRLIHTDPSPAARQKKTDVKLRLKQSLFSAVSQADYDRLLKLFSWTTIPVSTRGEGGNTVLHTAVSIGSEQGVSLLLAIGADVYARNDGGDIPLHDAAFEGRLPIARMLVLFGADPCMTDEPSENFDENSSHLSSMGIDPIQLARHEGHCDLANWLITVRPGQLDPVQERLALHSVADAVRYVVARGHVNMLDLRRLTMELLVKLWPLVGSVWPVLKYRLWWHIEELIEERMRCKREVGILIAMKVSEAPIESVATQHAVCLRPVQTVTRPSKVISTKMANPPPSCRVVQIGMPPPPPRANSFFGAAQPTHAIDEALAACALREQSR